MMGADLRGPPARPSRLTVDPNELPLCNAAWRFAVLWSPKSACTSTLIWFIGTLGRIDEARRFDPWPHKWRIQVYNREPQRREALGAFDADWNVLRVIRDPYSRAVGIYRHCLQHGLEGQRIAAFLGRSLRGVGYSFTEFVEFLSASDIRRLDPHVRPQRKPFEAALRLDRVINVSRQDLFAELNAFEDDLGRPRTDFRGLTWLGVVERPRRTNRIEFDGDVSGARFTAIFAKDGGDWPESGAFLTPVTRRMIEKVYAADFTAYADYLEHG